MHTCVHYVCVVLYLEIYKVPRTAIPNQKRYMCIHLCALLNVCMHTPCRIYGMLCFAMRCYDMLNYPMLSLRPSALTQGWATGGPRAESGPRGPLNRPLACHLY